MISDEDNTLHIGTSNQRTSKDSEKSENSQFNKMEQSNTDVQHVTVRLPSCWKHHIALWFAQAEAQFVNSRIKDDLTKYYIIIAALDSEALQCVSDIVIKPPANEKYLRIKSALIERLQDSEEKRLTQLLTGIQLQDRKPSELLRHMTELAGPAIAESNIVKTLWLQRLPQQVQAILSAIPDNNLDQLASAADKIVDVYQTTECTAVDNRNQPGTSRMESENIILLQLQNQMAALTEEMKKLKMNNNNPYNHQTNFRGRRHQSPRRYNNHQPHSTSNNSWRPRTGSRGRSPQKSSNGYCSAHAKYGDKAYKCFKPCTFHRNQSGNDKGSPQ